MAIGHNMATFAGTVRELMRRRAFMQGVRDVRDGKPMDLKFINGDVRDRCGADLTWPYERGRLFGILSNIPTEEIKNGQRVTYRAAQQYAYFQLRGWII